MDFGSAVLSEKLEAGRAWTASELASNRESNRMYGLPELRRRCLRTDIQASQRPYSRGLTCARTARKELGLALDQSIGGVEGLSRIMGADGRIVLSPQAPGSLRGFQTVEANEPVIIVEDEGETASAFVLARAAGDYLVFGSRAACVADLYTDRQAIGRAFAAEFMAPSKAVVRMIVDEDRSVAQVSDHFGVSASVIHRQYENNWR